MVGDPDGDRKPLRSELLGMRTARRGGSRSRVWCHIPLCTSFWTERTQGSDLGSVTWARSADIAEADIFEMLRKIRQGDGVTSLILRNSRRVLGLLGAADVDVAVGILKEATTISPGDKHLLAAANALGERARPDSPSPAPPGDARFPQHLGCAVGGSCASCATHNCSRIIRSYPDGRPA